MRLTDAGRTGSGRTGYFVIQANVKKSAKMNAVPTQIHILPVSPVPESPDSPTVHASAALGVTGNAVQSTSFGAAPRGGLRGFRRERGETVDERRGETGIESTERVTRELGDEPLGELPAESDGEPVDDGLVVVRPAAVDLGDIRQKAGTRGGVGG